MSLRLSLALEDGFDPGPAGGICVLRPRADLDLSRFPKDRILVVQPFRPDFESFAAQGYRCVPSLPEERFAASLVCLTRSRIVNRDLVASAARQTDGPVLVDGAKTDGIDSLLKELRKRIGISQPIAKAHGKVAWFTAEPKPFDDWQVAAFRDADGFKTAPGVFSADGVDPASALLRDALPADLGRRVGDLGAGWGYLSAAILEQTQVETLHLVEADHVALECARLNLAEDARAKFHWADATTWKAPAPLDAIVMNPPFHTTRSAEPELGQRFITSAASNLSPRGQLWMVANRHLPYEDILAKTFAKVTEVCGNGRFKLLHAARPRRNRV